MSSARRVLLILGSAVVLGGLLTALGWFVVVPTWRPSLGPGEAYGVDVSHHQGPIAWPQVAADGIGYAYVKATEGRGYADPLFRQNWTDSAQAGIRHGAYHFFTVCAPGAEQARNFLRVVPPDPTALTPAVDLELIGSCTERPPVADVYRELADFLLIVERAWGRPALIYLRSSWSSQYPDAAGPLADGVDRPRWRTRFFLRPSTEWAVWQVHYFGRVPGIEGRVDLDVVRPAVLLATS